MRLVLAFTFESAPKFVNNWVNNKPKGEMTFRGRKWGRKKRGIGMILELVEWRKWNRKRGRKTKRNREATVVARVQSYKGNFQRKITLTLIGLKTVQQIVLPSIVWIYAKNFINCIGHDGCFEIERSRVRILCPQLLIETGIESLL